MRPALHLIALLGASVIVAAPVPKALKKKSDVEVFVGTWEVVCTHNGQPSSEGVWTFDPEAKVLSVAAPGAALASKYHVKLDPTKSPGEIDLGELKGIYAIDGDDIRVAFTNRGDRPTGFDPKRGVFDNRLRRLPDKAK